MRTTSSGAQAQSSVSGRAGVYSLCAENGRDMNDDLKVCIKELGCMRTQVDLPRCHTNRLTLFPASETISLPQPKTVQTCKNQYFKYPDHIADLTRCEFFTDDHFPTQLLPFASFCGVTIFIDIPRQTQKCIKYLPDGSNEWHRRFASPQTYKVELRKMDFPAPYPCTKTIVHKLQVTESKQSAKKPALSMEHRRSAHAVQV